MKSFVSVLVALLLSSFALAIEVEAPKEADPHTLVRVRAKVEAKGYAWFVIGPFGFADVETNGGSAVFTGPPGMYRTILVTSDKDGMLQQGQASTKILGTPLPGPVPGPEPLPPPGPGPGPTPTPTPTPTPVPTDAFASEVLTMLNALPKYDKAKVLTIASNYDSIGSQGSDPARSAGWDLAAFTTKTKELNREALTTTEVAEWSPPFFTPLAKKQFALFTERGLKNTDRAEIAKLWKETARAIQDAVKAKQ